MSTVEEAIVVYWTSPYPLAVLLVLGASLATLSFVYMGNARNARLRVSLLTGFYGLSTFFWLFVAGSLVLCVLEKDRITYETSGVQVAAAGAVAFGLVGSLAVAAYVWRRAPLRLLASLRTRRPGPKEGWVQEYIDLLAAYEGVPSPRLLVWTVDGPECMAIGGPGGDVVVVSEGLFRLLDRDEVRAAVAHEFVHVRNRDARFKVFSTVMSRLLFFDPISKFLDPALHREREYLADEMGARLHGRPASLASALVKIDEAAPPTPSHWALGVVGAEGSVFSRYPPLKERVRRLLLLSRILGSG
jgi:heat shock protein HtpX